MLFERKCFWEITSFLAQVSEQEERPSKKVVKLFSSHMALPEEIGLLHAYFSDESEYILVTVP